MEYTGERGRPDAPEVVRAVLVRNCYDGDGGVVLDWVDA
jgi:hypothetical protein